jgi:hypothetical protein
MVQKVLPKFNGGRELETPLSELLAFSLDGAPRAKVDESSIVNEARRRLSAQLQAVAQPSDEDEAEGAIATTNQVSEGEAAVPAATTTGAVAPAVYSRTARELVRLLTRLRVNGFVSYLE